jgi:hypothetical protein
MPTPSAAFRSAFASLPKSPPISVTTANKLYLSALQKTPELRPGEFLSTAVLQNKKPPSRTWRFSDIGDLQEPEVVRRLVAQVGPGQAAWSVRLLLWARANPSRTFDSLADLASTLEDNSRGKHAGDPLVVDGAKYASLIAAIATLGTGQISQSSLRQRIADLRRESQLDPDQPLVLTLSRWQQLTQRKPRRVIAADDFKARLRDYCDRFGLRPGIDPKVMYDRYASEGRNSTPLPFVCLSCEAKHGEAEATFGKALSRWTSQGCRTCGLARIADGVRLSEDVVRRRVERHPAGITWVNNGEGYGNSKQLLTLRCLAHGHEFQRTLAQLRDRRATAQCPECSPTWVQEALCVRVVQHLLGVAPTGPIGWCTPPMATSNSPTCGHPKFPQART